MICVWLSVLGNIGLLAYFKYFNFFIDNANHILGSLNIAHIPLLEISLPLGISFYTFQTLSYQIDLYRGKVKAQRSLRDFSLFVSLFPQLIAGPIVRYKEIERQLSDRKESIDQFFYGCGRFICGLGKKVLIADGLAPLVDSIFVNSPSDLSVQVVWLGLAAFLLQIYYDFSGYSDMAIGIGRMFGFRLPENFRYPYSARSITAFWQRWHMTLTAWLRDYVFTSIVSKKRSSLSTDFAIFFVFLLCGFWHGANWTFIVFGAYFGLILIIERHYWQRYGRYMSPALQHLYVVFILLLSVAFFRSPNLTYALELLARAFSFQNNPQSLILVEVLNNERVIILISGTLFSMPLVPFILKMLEKIDTHSQRSVYQAPLKVARQLVPCFACLLVFLLSVIASSAATYNPFIYFQF